MGPMRTVPLNFQPAKDRPGLLNFNPDKDLSETLSPRPEQDQPAQLSHLQTDRGKEVLQNNDKAGPTA